MGVIIIVNLLFRNENYIESLLLQARKGIVLTSFKVEIRVLNFVIRATEETMGQCLKTDTALLVSGSNSSCVSPQHLYATRIYDCQLYNWTKP